MKTLKPLKQDTAIRKGSGLVDLVFSWSIDKVLNADLYKDTVKDIPEQFFSTSQYFKAFIDPLIEETHAEFSSGLRTLPQAPFTEILSVHTAKGFKFPNKLVYKIILKEPKKLGVGDLFAITDIIPKSIADLERPGKPYLIALVEKFEYTSEFTIRSSKPLDFKEGRGNTYNNHGKLFATYLLNMTTNIRIWKTLIFGDFVGNLDIIKKVLKNDWHESCDHFENCSDVEDTKNILTPFKLNESQEAAILSCIYAVKHAANIDLKLIWGPPGTGKTKTVASLLFVLLKTRTRTVTCAPTNIAVVEIASRLVKLMDVIDYDTYGLGDIVLFGNEDRMKITDHDELTDIFLDHRANMLLECFAPFSGWRHELKSMINLLEDPVDMYRNYLEDFKVQEQERMESGIKDNDNIVMKQGKEKMKGMKRDYQSDQKIDNEKSGLECDEILTFEEFIRMTFESCADKLIFCFKTCYTHLPTFFIRCGVVREMLKSQSMLNSISSLLKVTKLTNSKLYTASSELISIMTDCLQVLRSLSSLFTPPLLFDGPVDLFGIKTFCLSSALLVFCTATGSVRLQKIPGLFEFLVIDEAAQLKECESAIPLQVDGLHHAVLIGDENQLPAMVNSKISKEAWFGRSLFERLVMLGYKKHLLNTQYRMHPSISIFPNTEFYDGQILDAPAVMHESYKKYCLPRKLYGAFSFIDIKYGREERNDNHSSKNMVEVAVVTYLVDRIFKECVTKKKKISVGVISPYNAQVSTLENILGKIYPKETTDNGFSLHVRTVDGYQGGEDDVIIISTVRCNRTGSIGFLSDPQRANVALTRARHKLCVLGNGATLLKSGSVWNKLVTDAKQRNCFFDASDDRSMAMAIIIAMLKLNRANDLVDAGSWLFTNTPWKVLYSYEFWVSMAQIQETETQSKVLLLLEKLALGWRHPSERKKGVSSEMLKVYNVDGIYKMVWTVDTIDEYSGRLQVLKIWDVSSLARLPSVTTDLGRLFTRRYSPQHIRNCIAMRMEGHLQVPVRWQKETREEVFLSSRLASLRLR